jgi:hypothetical protein
VPEEEPLQGQPWRVRSKVRSGHVENACKLWEGWGVGVGIPKQRL